MFSGHEIVPSILQKPKSNLNFNAGELVTLRFTYTKPDNLRTHWKFGRGLPGRNPSSLNLLNLESLTKTPGQQNQITETLKFIGAIENSGTYQFEIFETPDNVTISTTFQVNIVAAPSNVALNMVNYAYPENVQFGKNYDFHCKAKGNPLPDISWQFNPCLQGSCEWKNLSSASSNDSEFYQISRVSLKLIQKGKIKCTANNSLGQSTSTELEVIPSDIEGTEDNYGVTIYRPYCSRVFVGSSVNITCQMRKFGFRGMSWSMKTASNKNVTLSDQPKYDVQHFCDTSKCSFSNDLRSSNFSEKYFLTLHNLSMSDSGHYQCTAYNSPPGEIVRELYLEVEDSLPLSEAEIVDENSFDIGEDIVIPCRVKDSTPHDVIWYKGDLKLNITDSSRYTITSEGLKITKTMESDQDLYVCDSSLARKGQCEFVTQSIRLCLKKTKTRNIIFFVGGFTVLGFFIVFVGSIVRMNYRRSHNLANLQQELEENKFDPCLPKFEMMEYSPVINPSFSDFLSLDQLKRNRNLISLGVGTIGIVQQVGLKKPDGSVVPVALKRPKSHFDTRQYRMLYKEICLRSFLGKHPNIVNLIGIVTRIAQGRLYMVTELCSDGSLLDLLRSTYHSNQFRSEIHMENGKTSYMGEVFPTWPEIKPGISGSLFHTDLISYAYQVASGMEYLASLDFVHKALTARNVLLTDQKMIAKISNFSACYKDSHSFESDKTSHLIRWTAPEAILMKKFSIYSDVWSFGILLAEIFDLGITPFANVSEFNRNFVNQLRRGEIQLKKPAWATENLHQLILNCCQPKRKDRVSFREVKSVLADELHRCNPEHLQKLLSHISAVLDEIEGYSGNIYVKVKDVKSYRNSNDKRVVYCRLPGEQ